MNLTAILPLVPIYVLLLRFSLPSQCLFRAHSVPSRGFFGIASGISCLFGAFSVV